MPSVNRFAPLRGISVALLLLALAVAGCEVRRTLAPESTRQIQVAEVRRLVERPALSPAVWAPGGRRVAYSAGPRLWVVSLDGTEREIAPVEVATTISWSAPLNMLAVVDRGVVWTMRDDGAERQKIDLPGLALQAVWAPGSDRLAVVVRRVVEGTALFELWLVNRDGSFRRMVAQAPVGRAIRDLQWFPDSLYLLYGLSAPADQVILEVWRVRVSYPDRRKLPLDDPATSLRLAPSGKRIAYLSGPEVEDGRGRVVVSWLDSTGRFDVTPDEGRYSGLTWSPQGDKLAFAALRDEANADIWIADADGSGRLHIFPYPLEFSDPSIVLSASWAPDGRHIVFGTNSGSFTGPIWLATLERR